MSENPEDIMVDYSGADEALKQVSDVAKQLVTLASAIIGGFVAAVKAGLFSLENDPFFFVFVFFASMIFVIIFSFLLQLAIAGVHDSKTFPNRSYASKEAAKNPSIYYSNIRLILALMLIAFVVAMSSLSILVVF